jgi:quercetin dioxygenase-like cupin family protein
MDVIGSEQRVTTRARADYFTGTVWLDPIAVAASPGHLRAYRVSFEPGARTAWHTHPLGQVLHVLTGVGRAQCAGGPVLTLRPGDTVLIQAGERHWHGAAPENAMCHLAMQEADGKGVDVEWLEQVTDSQYRG